MGLLGYIVRHGLDKPHGLLACATRMLQDGAGGFAPMCISLGAYHATLLSERDGIFRTIHAFGLDAGTFVSSVSSATWWKGMLNDEGVRTFNRMDGTLTACYQLFSSQFRDSMTDMIAVLVEPSVVFVCVALQGEMAIWGRGGMVERDVIRRVMKQLIEGDLEKKNVADTLLDDNVRSKIKAALEMSDAVLCRLDVSNAVEESLAGLSNAPSGVMCDVREALYGELLQMARYSFPPPAYCADDKDGTIRLVLFANADFDQDLALFHIQHHLESVLGTAVEDVDLLDALKATDMDEIVSFID